MSERNQGTRQNTLRIEVTKESLPKRIIKTGLAAGAVVVGAMFLLGTCSGKVEVKHDVVVTKADVFSVTPADINIRAIEKDKVELAASKSFGTPVDHIPVVGLFTRAFERTTRVTSIFTGPKGKGGGEIDTLVGATADGVYTTVSEDKKHQVVHLPTRDIKLFSAVKLDSFDVLERDGIGADIGRVEWTMAGGIMPHQRDEVEVGRAAVNAMSMEAAVNIAQTTCASAAWPLAKLAIQDGYRIEAEAQYTTSVEHSAHLAPFNPTSLTVEFEGPPPRVTPPYILPKRTHVSSSNGHKSISCTVNTDAYVPIAAGSYVDAAKHPIPTSLNDMNFDVMPAPISPAAHNLVSR